MTKKCNLETEQSLDLSEDSCLRRSSEDTLIDNIVRRELVIRAKTCPHARQEYRRLNMGLLKKIVRDYAHWVTPCDVDDLNQEAEIGLLQGIMHFKEDLGADKKPEAYVFWWVRAKVSDYARKHGAMSKASREVSEIDNGDGEFESIVDTISSGDHSLDVLSEAKDHCPEDGYKWRDRHALLATLAAELPQREQTIANCRIMNGDETTLSSLGVILNLSRERVRQLEIDVIRKLTRRVRLASGEDAVE